MKHGSLFSGIGGFDLAAEWMGWENVFHCEWNEFGQRVLHHYWPQAIQYNDITKTDFTIHRGAIDILTGGFPCQPYSAAGKRLGKDDERHLWPEMLRAIREIQPRWVVGENVRGLTNWNGGLVFDEVQSDLEALGYEVLPFLLPACAKDAPHRRDRIWFVAYSSGNGGDRTPVQAGGKTWRQNGQSVKQFEQRSKVWITPHTTSDGLHDKPTARNNTVGADNKQPRTQRVSPVKGFGDERATTDTNNRSRPQHAVSTGREELKELHGASRATAHTERSSSAGQHEQRPKSRQLGGLNSAFIVADSDSRRQPGKEYRQAKPRRTAKTSVRVDWQNFPTQPPICGGNDGLPTELDGITFPKWRNESIKAYGNAVVPQVVYEIFKAIEAYQDGRDL